MEIYTDNDQQFCRPESHVCLFRETAGFRFFVGAWKTYHEAETFYDQLTKAPGRYYLADHGTYSIAGKDKTVWTEAA